MRTVPRLCEVYPDICLTTEEKARENLSEGSRRMPVGKEYTEQSILVNRNTDVLSEMLVVTTKEGITPDWFPHCSLGLSNHMCVCTLTLRLLMSYIYIWSAYS